ncbi:hypothetical protein Ancab_018203 [Ancistrocladus abbreviatus]
MGAFWGTRVMEIVKKHDSGGLVWKRIKLTSTRKANAKKRLLRVWQESFVFVFYVPVAMQGLAHNSDLQLAYLTGYADGIDVARSVLGPARPYISRKC